jgi:hypothetical protein
MDGEGEGRGRERNGVNKKVYMKNGGREIE